MSTPKTLSNGTLGLKFMQNALRAQQAKEVQFEKAEVKDDGEWEVSKAVREAWGLTGGSQSADAQVHEESYLPFLFTETSADEPESRPRGRRVFGKRGEEIATEETATEERATVPSPKTEPSTGKGKKIHPRPVTIATAGSSGGFLRGFDQLKKPREGGSSSTGKSARQMLFESGDVGTDLRTARLQNGDDTSARTQSFSSSTIPESAKPKFMKPAGVDEPSRPSMKDADDDKANEKKSKRKRQNVSTEAGHTKKLKKDRQNPT